MEVQPEASQKLPPQVSRSFRLRNPSLNTVRLRRIFETFDGNGDGKITAVELGQALQRLGLPVPAPELKLTIDGFLRPGTDGLDFDGFSELHRSLGDNLLGGVAEESGAEENGGEEEDLKEAFRVFDEDGDGFISAAELQGVLHRLGLADAHDVERMIENVDENNDGMVDLKEFKHMMTQGVTVKSS